jgi:2,5-diamino-6-(ribosylamino)-4(3H)-pyrimidinone 5'-phosphate reductase
MDRPQVIIANLISLDGRLDGFPADVGLYYDLASRLPHQAVLTGSGTMLAAAASEGIDLSEEDPEPLRGMRVTGPGAAGDPRPLLVIVDGQGRLTRHAWLREQPFWRDVLALCSAGLSRVDPAAKSGLPGGLAGALRQFIPPRRSPC